jgi:RNA polymerase sigma factor (sigma-70 family)
MTMLDPALRPYLDAPDEEEADRHLGTLLEERIVPLVRRIVAHKLRGDAGEVEDVASDALLMLVGRLRSAKTDASDAEPIQNLETYAATVTFNACAHALRLRHPARARLKNRIRYVLGRNPRFHLWPAEGGGWMCGRAAWTPARPEPAAGEKLAALDADPATWATAACRALDLDRDDPAPAIDAVLGAAGGPLDLDRLVSIVARLGPGEGARAAQPDAELAERQPADREQAIDLRRFAERLWDEVQELPERQRAALLLNLRDADGSGALWILPVTGVASMREIAQALGLADLELAELWARLPLDDRTIAERLGCTRQQVINLRMSARKRLANRLGGPGPGGANLRRFSRSSGSG